MLDSLAGSGVRSFSDFGDLGSVLRMRAHRQPESVAYKFLREGEGQETSITYRQLHERALRIACKLAALEAFGKPVILLYPMGPDYISAFFGCLYAGAIAVPAYPPRLNRSLSRLESIIRDAQPVVGLTSRRILGPAQQALQHLPAQDLRWVSSDSDDLEGASHWQPPQVHSDTIALLQYTSGSTTEPKGVIVTHGNLLHNSLLIQQCFGNSEHSRIVSWLPPYHDMGLIGGILQPLFVGCLGVLMPPPYFLHSPLRWLQALSSEKATSTVAPNFAYELCARRISPAEREHLDLSSVTGAGCGSEPIQTEVIEAFTEFFAPCGFRPEAFRPCYGLAEATLMVSGHGRPEPPVIGRFDPVEFQYHRLADWNGQPHTRPHCVVGCGSVCPGVKVEIVDPATGVPCGPEQVGEIWVAGRSVAQGYWKRPQETANTFHARLPGSTKGCFLRTGDFGFLKNGQLFIAGRKKELIVIRGRNYYPQDLEAVASRSHPKLNGASCAAFTSAENGQERLVIVQEIPRTRPPLSDNELDTLIAAIRRAIHEEQELPVGAVILVDPLEIPKTSSGKIQRHGCRDAYLAGRLKIVKKWVRAEEERPSSPALRILEQELRRRPTLGRIRRWLVLRVSQATGLTSKDLDHRTPLSQCGLDSLAAVTVGDEIGSLLNLQLAPTLIWDHPCIEDLAVYLAEQLRSKPSPHTPAALNAELAETDRSYSVQEAGSLE